MLHRWMARRAGIRPHEASVVDNRGTVGSGVVAKEANAAGMHHTQLVLEDLAIALTDEAGVVAYGSHKLYDFPEGVIMVLGATMDLALTKSSAGVDADWNGDVALGTAAANNNTTLTDTEEDVIPSTATPEAVAGVTTADGESIGTVADYATTVDDIIPLNELMQPTGIPMTATPADGLFALSWGTHGTATPKLVGNAASGGAKTSIGRYQYTVPDDFVAGSDLTVTIRAVEAVGAATVETTLDVQAFIADRDGAVVATDACTTAAQDVTDTAADLAFTLSHASLTAGDVIDIEITAVANDTGGSVGTIATINEIKITRETAIGAKINEILDNIGASVVKVFDGSATAKDLYVNLLVDDVDHDVTTTPCNLILNGTIDIAWMNLGDN